MASYSTLQTQVLKQWFRPFLRSRGGFSGQTEPQVRSLSKCQSRSPDERSDIRGSFPHVAFAHAGYNRFARRAKIRSIFRKRSGLKLANPRAPKIEFRLSVQADLGRPVIDAKIFLFRIFGN
jgi:hypothetical protein